MDFNMVNAGRANQPQRQQVSSYDFAALAKWERSGVGTANSTEFISAWVEETVETQQTTVYMEKGNAANRIRIWIENGNPAATLDLASCDLLSCPPLPHEVQNLSLAWNPQLDTLPHALPPGLKVLNINFCNFTQLPHDWPVGLRELWLVTNKVTKLPDTLPASLQILCATNNQLGSVPRNLPEALQKLYLSTNRIVELDPGLLSLPRCTKLLLCNNPLSEASRTLLNEHTSVPGYAGPAVKIGVVVGPIDLSSWIPESRSAQMRDSECPPIIHRRDASLIAMVNAALRANPGKAVASYADQYKTVIQVMDLLAGRGNSGAGPSNT